MSDNSEQQLLSFASQLRDAHRPHELSSDFEQNLNTAIRSKAGLRHAFQQSRFIRTAAALLIVCMLGVPAAALMGVFPLNNDDKITLSYIPATWPDAESIAELEHSDPANNLVPPLDEYLNDRVFLQRVSVLEAQMFWQWQLRGLPGQMRAPILAAIDNMLAQIAASSKTN
ncbi:MAG: hypothetical protein QGF46_01345 [Planctomycetota bacterium]|jgi:hypothetical protein|nr:hypothetical protein [Planctomycetota bacterium]